MKKFIKSLRYLVEDEDSPLNDRTIRVCLFVLVFGVGGFFYARYLHNLTHHKVVHPATVAGAATYPNPPAPADYAAPASAPTPAPAAAPSAPTAAGDSIMAVIEPSAKAETVQPEFPSALDTPKPATLAAARQPLPAQKPKPVAPAPELTPEQKRLAAAQTAFDNVLEFAVNYPDPYGFAPGESLDAAKLGDPIPVYTISKHDRLNYQAGQPVKPLLKPTGEYVYPIILGDTVRFMVQVRNVNGKFVTGSGSKALALVYEKIQENWPATEGYHPQLVVNDGVPDYYFTVPELPLQNITDTSRMFDLNPALSPADVILASWR